MDECSLRHDRLTNFSHFWGAKPPCDAPRRMSYDKFRAFVGTKDNVWEYYIDIAPHATHQVYVDAARRAREALSLRMTLKLRRNAKKGSRPGPMQDNGDHSGMQDEGEGPHSSRPSTMG